MLDLPPGQIGKAQVAIEVYYKSLIEHEKNRTINISVFNILYYNTVKTMITYECHNLTYKQDPKPLTPDQQRMLTKEVKEELAITKKFLDSIDLISYNYVSVYYNCISYRMNIIYSMIHSHTYSD